METMKMQLTQEIHQTQLHFMNKLSPKLKPTIDFRSFICFSSLSQTQNPEIVVPVRKRRVVAATSNAKLKENWLSSISYSSPENSTHLLNQDKIDASKWFLGIDPDVSGAVALLKIHDSVCSAQVFDSPHVQLLVGKTTRKRLNANSIVQLVRSFDAPAGTTAYIEQSIPFPKDGKQGWWSGGFGYGLWIGILVSSGFTVVPVPSFTWKAKFELSGSKTSKDDSRKLASQLFPSLSSLLTRKKDHGRAEALLIAAYGKDQNKSHEPTDTITDEI
ncbi:Holliday junction resolvase MOC1, chloroplastic [Trifolium pratense]|uniref:Holliday junction resolvase MOC1, chloroplastic n=1 Tax=Trifolium pratense TaxID=57577 RepID=UPI001E6978F2|nr:Holliday junction resolvase MOC1, chloroplastic [Trifolium pratense]